MSISLGKVECDSNVGKALTQRDWGLTLYPENSVETRRVEVGVLQSNLGLSNSSSAIDCCLMISLSRHGEAEATLSPLIKLTV
jgi:hypothetical protein